VSCWNRIVFAAGVLTGVLGLIVIAGWLAHAAAVIQIGPTLAPMQFNTALGLLTCGVGFVLLASGHSARFVRPCGLAVLFLGGATLLEYALNRSLGIDRLFHGYTITTQAPHPGRMSPISTVLFVCIGSALALLGGRDRAGAFAIAGSLSLIVTTIAGVVFMGYVSGIGSTAGWGDVTRIALHTSLAFVLLGGAGFLAAWIKSDEIGSSCDKLWIAMSTGMAILLASVFLWQALVAQQDAQLELSLAGTANFVRDDIATRVTGDIRALERMARRWEANGGWREAVWGSDAESYAVDMPEFQAIEWIDPTMHVRWVRPVHGNERIVGFNVLAGTPRRYAVLEARRSGRVTLSRPVDLIQGGAGFLIYVPITVHGRFAGMIAGVCKFSNIMARLPPRIKERYDVDMLAGGQTVYDGPVSGAGPWLLRSRAIAFDNQQWNLRITPTRATVATYRTPLPEMLLVAGVLIAVLMVIMIRVTQIAHDTASDLRGSRRTIDDFVVVLEFQKAELENANMELTEIAATDGLTGVKNRRAFTERLDEQFAYARRHNVPLSLILADIDEFKRLNDVFGHQVGDDVLKQIAGVFHDTVREYDFVARFGGEEFAVLALHTDTHGATVLAERLRTAVESFSWTSRAITISVGVAPLTPGMVDADALVKEADDALYRSKARGRNTVTVAGTLERVGVR
jgi:diguanylate cyclase (GGDEF)-like protein